MSEFRRAGADVIVDSVAKLKVAWVLAVVAAGAAAVASAQVAPIAHKSMPVSIDSGPVRNTGSDVDLVFSTTVEAPGAPWMRLVFDKATLLDGAEKEAGSYLVLTSLRDGARQYFDAEQLRQWRFTSAYFNGDAVRIELYAQPGGGVSRVRLKRVIAGAASGTRSICGLTDDRVPYEDARVCRIMPVGCTGWIINDGNHGLLTAGHCVDANDPNNFDLVQFNVPPSDPNTGEVRCPPCEDQYLVDRASLQSYLGSGEGVDWAYFGCVENTNTRLTPYEAQRGAFTLVLPESPAGDLRVTGFGQDDEPERNQTLQTHVGSYESQSGTAVRYRVDTRGGNSGSPVMLPDEQRAIAVHTNGGCGVLFGTNFGTGLNNRDLLAAIANPLGLAAWTQAGSWFERSELFASDGDLNKEFGSSIAVSLNRIVVGSRRDFQFGAYSGAAYVFRWDDLGWAQEQKLVAPDGDGSDYFGDAADIAGDIIVVGAPWKDTSSTFTGAAYVYRFDGLLWLYEQKLAPLAPGSGGGVGESVAVSGDRIVLGAPYHDPGGVATGAAFVYRWDGSQWALEDTLLPSDGAHVDAFGWSVDVSGDIVVVGAVYDDDNGDSSGSAYVFRWNGGSWVEEAKLLPADGRAFDQFGYSVARSGDRIVVGTGFRQPGAAYVFSWNGSVWSQQAQLTASDAAPDDGFGASVAICGGRVVVGAHLRGDNGPSSGAAYVYRWEIGAWVEESKLLPADGAQGDYFGYSVDISGETVAVGAMYDDGMGFNAGSAYVYHKLEHPCPRDLNADGDTDATDHDIVVFDLGCTGGSCAGDLDGDGDTDLADFAIVQHSIGCVGW